LNRSFGLFAILAAGLALRAEASTFGFYPGGSVPAGPGPYDAKASNHDLFLAEVPNNAIRWIRNDGQGGFSESILLPENQPIALEFADVNGDGRPDLLSGNWGDSKVSVRLHTGGILAYASEATRLPMGSGNIRDMTAADLDGDAIIDVATVNTDGRCYLRKGNGDGTFGPLKFISGGTVAKAITAADVNADGRNDLVIVDYGSDRVIIHRNTGNLNFATSVLWNAGEKPNDAIVRDFDGDGDLDIAVVGENGTAALLVNDGTGAFGERRGFTIGPLAQTLVASDFDGDGDVDLAFPAYNAESASVFLNSGSGAFTLLTSLLTGTGVRALASFDRNGDGRDDLAAAYDGGLVSLFDNFAGPPPSRETCGLPMIATGSNPVQVIVPDLDGDGRSDLVTANEGGTVSCRLRRADGGFGSRVDLPTQEGTTSVAAGDIDGDGLVDLVAANPRTFDLTVWRNLGAGAFESIARLLVSAGPRFVRLADIDRDGRLDFVTVNEASGGSVTILFNRSGETWRHTLEPVLGADAPVANLTPVAAGGSGPVEAQGGRFDLAVGHTPTMLDVGDVSGDGFPDLVVGTGDGSAVLYIQSLGQGRFSPPRALSFPGRSVQVTDWMNDGGVLDLLVADDATSCVRIAWNSRGGSDPFSLWQSIAVGPSPTAFALVPGHFDEFSSFVWINRDGILGSLPYDPMLTIYTGGYKLGPECLLGGDAISLAVTRGPDDANEVFAVVRGSNAVAWSRIEPPQARPVAAGLDAVRPGFAFRLEPPSPNPAARGSAIAFTMPTRAHVRIGLYDVRGRLLRELMDEDSDPGQHTVHWDGTDASGARAAPGLYFVRFVSPLGTRVERQVVVAR